MNRPKNLHTSPHYYFISDLSIEETIQKIKTQNDKKFYRHTRLQLDDKEIDELYESEMLRFYLEELSEMQKNIS